MRGTQISLLVAFTVGIVSTIIGTIVGALAGYFRGFAEAFLMRMTDLVIIIPLLALAAVLARAASDKGVFFLALMLAIVTWTGLARLVRGEVLSFVNVSLSHRLVQLGPARGASFLSTSCPTQSVSSSCQPRCPLRQRFCLKPPCPTWVLGFSHLMYHWVC